MRTREKLRDLRQYWAGKAEEVSIAGDAARAALVMLQALQAESKFASYGNSRWAKDTLKEAARAWEGR
jgi:hypothetical protein